MIIGLPPRIARERFAQYFGEPNRQQSPAPVIERRGGRQSKTWQYPNGSISITTDVEPKPLPPAIAARLARLERFDRQQKLAAARAEMRAIEREIERRKSQPALFDRDLPYSQRRNLSAKTLKIIDYVRSQSPEHRGPLTRLYVDYHEINAQFFNGKLDLPEIVVGGGDKTSLARCYTTRTPRKIEFSPATLADYENNDLGGCYGALVHEAIHAYIGPRTTPLDYETDGHGEEFTKIANRIGRKLGLVEVSAHKPKGDALCSRHWPLAVPKSPIRRL